MLETGGRAGEGRDEDVRLLLGCNKEPEWHHQSESTWEVPEIKKKRPTERQPGGLQEDKRRTKPTQTLGALQAQNPYQDPLEAPSPFIQLGKKKLELAAGFPPAASLTSQDVHLQVFLCAAPVFSSYVYSFFLSCHCKHALPEGTREVTLIPKASGLFNLRTSFCVQDEFEPCHYNTIMPGAAEPQQ